MVQHQRNIVMQLALLQTIAKYMTMRTNALSVKQDTSLTAVAQFAIPLQIQDALT